ncbi:hypothetical protein K438DRAFT_2013347 [Mycena galopus ATCC 62051]|nr:hypothetical protein K438DRAFT_2013347 [Mycena galopus ATCC 62051]
MRMTWLEAEVTPRSTHKKKTILKRATTSSLLQIPTLLRRGQDKSQTARHDGRDITACASDLPAFIQKLLHGRLATVVGRTAISGGSAPRLLSKGRWVGSTVRYYHLQCQWGRVRELSLPNPPMEVTVSKDLGITTMSRYSAEFPSPPQPMTSVLVEWLSKYTRMLPNPSPLARGERPLQARKQAGCASLAPPLPPLHIWASDRFHHWACQSTFIATHGNAERRVRNPMLVTFTGTRTTE